MNVYMLSFTSLTGKVARQDILDFLDTQREVLNWFAVMPSTILIVSRKSAKVLAELLIERFGSDITFVMPRVDPSATDGYINKEVWDFMNNPRSSGRWE